MHFIIEAPDGWMGLRNKTPIKLCVYIFSSIFQRLILRKKDGVNNKMKMFTTLGRRELASRL